MEHRYVEKDINHGQIKIDLECYQTPTEYAQVILYDDYLAYTITLTFDEEFFTTHQGQKVVLSLKEPYNNTNLQKTRDFDGQTLVFQSSPKFIISGFKEENIDFNAVITIENGSVCSYKEALELNF